MKRNETTPVIFMCFLVLSYMSYYAWMISFNQSNTLVNSTDCPVKKDSIVIGVVWMIGTVAILATISVRLRPRRTNHIKEGTFLVFASFAMCTYILFNVSFLLYHGSRYFNACQKWDSSHNSVFFSGMTLFFMAATTLMFALGFSFDTNNETDEIDMSHKEKR